MALGLSLGAACSPSPATDAGGTTDAGDTVGTTTSAGSADETTAGATAPQQACDRYIACVAAVDPSGVAEVVDGYGPEGTCWTPQTLDVCEQACVDARRQLWEQFPEESACADCEVDADCPGSGFVCDVGAGTCVDCSDFDPCDPGVCGEPGPECNACRTSADCDGSTCFEGQCGYEPLLPIASGNNWYYQLEIVGQGPNCLIDIGNSMYAGGFVLPDGREAMNFQGFCVDVFLFVIGTGDRVETYDEDGQLVVVSLDEPVADGHSWEASPGRTFTWNREPAPVTVPAGTFEDCWTRVEVGLPYTSTYCRGVGKVREALGDVDGYVAELESYQLF